jgi:pyridoxine 5-phosphate synthase
MTHHTPHSLRLGVNVDHVATLRQARGTSYPDPVEAAMIAQGAGADGITVHLREDRRHIQDADVERLLAKALVPVNLEMAAVPAMTVIAERLAPPRACLVPERREEVTTEGGLDVRVNAAAITDTVVRLAAVGTRVSLFVDPEPTLIEAIVATGAPAVEMHTGAYADALDAAVRDAELGRLRAFATAAAAAGLEVHAGHGLHTGNVGAVAAITEVVELNIGHAIIADAIFQGLPAAIATMRRAMLRARREAASG